MQQSQQQDTESQREKQGKKRKQLKHVLLDVTFKDKPKIIDLEIEHKPIARLLLMDILAACSAATDAEITLNVCRHLGNRIGIDAESVTKIIDYCIANEILWAIDGKITNSRVIKDQESYYKKLEQDRIRKGSDRKRSGRRKDPDIDIDIDIDRSNNKKIAKPQKKQFKEYVFLSEEEITKFRAELGDDVLRRCITKLDSWIASDPTIKKRKNGKNAAACFRSWVINAVSEEQQRALKSNNGSNGKSVDPRINTILKSLEAK